MIEDPLFTNSADKGGRLLVGYKDNGQVLVTPFKEGDYLHCRQPVELASQQNDTSLSFQDITKNNIHGIRLDDPVLASAEKPDDSTASILISVSYKKKLHNSSPFSGNTPVVHSISRCWIFHCL